MHKNSNESVLRFKDLFKLLLIHLGVQPVNIFKALDKESVDCCEESDPNGFDVDGTHACSSSLKITQ